jgi:hypothetical protein
VVDALLDLLHSELKQAIAQTITPSWKARILELAKSEDREYTIDAAFKVELEAAFRQIATFPERYAGRRARPGFASMILTYRPETQAPKDLMPWEELAAKLTEFSDTFFGRKGAARGVASDHGGAA